MIVFDADGTLIGGETTDWRCFGDAFETVSGFALTEAFFAEIKEVTAREIVHLALADRPIAQREAMEDAVRQEFLRRLMDACAANSNAFTPIPGALTLLREIEEAAIPVAIATGDWRETISFKLSAAGIPFEEIPMVTSSERYSRAEIISAAISKAGQSLDEAIYVGDGLWDLRACRTLGIAFLGVGHRRSRLLEAGASHVLENLSPNEFWKAREEAHRANKSAQAIP